MCDTLALKRSGAVWFAKNSDREAEEPQIVEAIAAVEGDSSPTVRCTCIEIDQVPNRRGVILSRPIWMWGAEMGVNDAGVAIGNEAVFSTGIARKGEALLGMDLVRLALERAATAETAVDIIISMLEHYGQGGAAGYRDKNFRYDNSFLIADPRSIFVVETAGRRWAVKEASDSWSISNAYTLRSDYDRSNDAPGADFKSRHETIAMPRLACAADRRRATLRAVDSAPDAMSLSKLAAILRSHARGDGFEKGSNRDVCMHSKGFLRPHASTASMIARLTPGDAPAVAFTGTIQPCISLYKPMGLTGDFSIRDERLFGLGRQAEKRAAADPAWRRALRASIAEAEGEILSLIEIADLAAAEALAREWTKNWLTPLG